MMQPLNGGVLVKPIIKDPNKDSKLLSIPNAQEEIPTRGTVVVASEDSKVNVGDYIMFPKLTGTEVELGDNKYLFIKEENIFGIIEEGDL